MDNELKKVFLFLDSAEIEYAERLQDLLKITDVLYQFAKDLNFEDGMENEAVELAFKVLENVYFMNSDFLKKIEASSPTKLQFV